ncbi:MAG: hypothetical protein JRI68_36080 [Deltaproteobacteria bacterium]|nr:hypothetical protein [Deltaproteobacteria bacterium]
MAPGLVPRQARGLERTGSDQRQGAGPILQARFAQYPVVELDGGPCLGPGRGVGGVDGGGLQDRPDVESDLLHLAQPQLHEPVGLGAIGRLVAQRLGVPALAEPLPLSVLAAGPLVAADGGDGHVQDAGPVGLVLAPEGLSQDLDVVLGVGKMGMSEGQPPLTVQVTVVHVLEPPLPLQLLVQPGGRVGRVVHELGQVGIQIDHPVDVLLDGLRVVMVLEQNRRGLHDDALVLQLLDHRLHVDALHLAVRVRPRLDTDPDQMHPQPNQKVGPQRLDGLRRGEQIEDVRLALGLHLGEQLPGPPGLLEEVLVHDREPGGPVVVLRLATGREDVLSGR